MVNEDSPKVTNIFIGLHNKWIGRSFLFAVFDYKHQLTSICVLYHQNSSVLNKNCLYWLSYLQFTFIKYWFTQPIRTSDTVILGNRDVTADIFVSEEGVVTFYHILLKILAPHFSNMGLKRIPLLLVVVFVCCQVSVFPSDKWYNSNFGWKCVWIE